MFKNKKGMEIAITTVVGLILGALMLFAGIALVTDIIGKTNDAQTKVSEQMEQDIIDAFDTNNLIYVHKNQITVKGSDDAVFGVGIHNIYGETRNFSISLSDVDVEKFEDEGVKVAFSEEDISIAPRDKAVTFIIVPTTNVDKGQHSLQLNVKHYNGSEWLSHGSPKLLYVIK